MASAVSELYEPLIERDLGSIAAAAQKFRKSHSSEELFLAVTRFAILAYAPSQHAKHAVLACLAAHALRDDYGERWDEILVECARYASESRQPWSEPPILDPPRVPSDEVRDVAALRAAVEAKDRLAAERWLAARLDDADLTDDLFTVAADDFEDFGHKVIMTSAAVRLASILGEKGRYATLRVAVWETTAYSGPRFAPSASQVVDPYERLVQNAIAEKGSIESMHRVFLYRAAEGSSVFARVCNYLAANASESPAMSGAIHSGETSIAPPVYRLARDYAQCLSAFALREPRLRAPAMYNLEHAASFADWSFA